MNQQINQATDSFDMEKSFHIDLNRGGYPFSDTNLWAIIAYLQTKGIKREEMVQKTIPHAPLYFQYKRGNQDKSPTIKKHIPTYMWVIVKIILFFTKK